VFHVMEQAEQHTFQVLTKRADRLAALAHKLPWPSNVWMGVSVESEEYLPRIDHLKSVPAAIRFLSLEPLIAGLPNLDVHDIGWVIVGGESGPGARPLEESWVQDIKAKCKAAQVPFFFKQWGGVQKKAAGRLLDGQIFDAMPVVASASSVSVVA